MTDDPSCIFCKILAEEVPATFLWEDGEVVAIADIHPAAPTHYLILPRRHIPSAADLTDADAPVVGHMIQVATALASRAGLTEPGRGYRLIINCGEEGGQTVPHLHLHLLGGEQLGHLST